jgi:pyruvate,water dikinase
MSVLQDGQKITLDCSQGMTGYVYDGHILFHITEVELAALPDVPVKIMLNLADPSTAFKHSYLPVTGIGLVRLEFIITNAIKVHPSALVHPEMMDDHSVHEQIAQITRGYKDGPTFFIKTLAHHIGMMAAAFYPRPVIVRLTDFKTNEYYNLIGGSYFELLEENPMIGFRGASRYYHPSYRDAFALECAALKKVREEMGFTNVKIMVPFVRTAQEAEKVIDLLAHHGLQSGKNDLELVMMCEIPSNVVLIDEFSKYFDGFSIGSNDLTQLTLGVDRDSEILAPLFDERDPAVKKMIQQAIAGAHKNNRFIGICGQAPSDHEDFAAFLLEQNIDSISLNADSIIPFFMNY